MPRSHRRYAVVVVLIGTVFALGARGHAADSKEGAQSPANEPTTDEQAVESGSTPSPTSEEAAKEGAAVPSPDADSEQADGEQPKEKCNDAAAKSAPAQPPLLHGVFRFTSYPGAWTAAQKTNRPILVYVTSQGCPHCVRMIELTYKRSAVMKLVAKNFETVYVDRQHQPKLIAKLKIQWYPTTIVVAPNNKVMDRIEGYVSPAAFTQRIQTQLAAHQVGPRNAQKSLVQK